DIIHRFYHEQLQIDNGVLQPSAGKMDKFVTWSDNGGLVFSYFHPTHLPPGPRAHPFTTDASLFPSAHGGSLPNHPRLIAAASPVWNQPLPTSNTRFVSNSNPGSLNDGNLTDPNDPAANGDAKRYVINTTFSVNLHPATTPSDQLLQNLNDSDPNQPNY